MIRVYGLAAWLLNVDHHNRANLLLLYGQGDTTFVADSGRAYTVRLRYSY